MDCKSLCEEVHYQVLLIYKKYAPAFRPQWRTFVDLYKKTYDVIYNSDIIEEEYKEISHFYKLEKHDIIISIMTTLLSDKNMKYAKEYIEDLGKKLKTNCDKDVFEEHFNKFNEVSKEKMTYNTLVYLLVYQISKTPEIMQIVGKLKELNRTLCDELQKLILPDRYNKLISIDLRRIDTSMMVFTFETNSFDVDVSSSICEFMKCVAEDESSDPTVIRVNY